MWFQEAAFKVSEAAAIQPQQILWTSTQNERKKNNKNPL